MNFGYRGEWWLLLRVGTHWLRWEGPFDWRSQAKACYSALTRSTAIRDCDLKIEEKQRQAA
jgi:hypothetical protein